MPKCGYCKAEVEKGAKKCQSCGHIFSRKDENWFKRNKHILIGLGIGIVFSLFFVYHTINKYSYKLSAAIIMAVIWMVVWLFIGCLIAILITLKSVFAWCTFLSGFIAFFYSVTFAELDYAGGLLQIQFITVFGIICGAVIGFFVTKIAKIK
jgi:hypothetical protein